MVEFFEGVIRLVVRDALWVRLAEAMVEYGACGEEGVLVGVLVAAAVLSCFAVSQS